MNDMTDVTEKPFFRFTCILILAFLTGCGTPEEEPVVSYRVPDQPEIATGYTPKPGWESSDFAVAAANPLATDAGYQILKAGGSAVDAAVAVQMVLTLVEPQSSGIGGGAFMMHWDGTEVTAYNGRETAPSDADESLFLDENGDPLPFGKAVHSGLSVGVPGTLAMLGQAHSEHGSLPWRDLFAPAITLAEEGFPISPRLSRLLSADEYLREDDIARELFYDDEGKAYPAGYILQNPALAQIFRDIADAGIPAFYNDELAGDIVDRVRNHTRPGTIVVDDIISYPDENLRVTPVCTPWRDYSVCGFPPPSSGHLTMMQILGIMEHLEVPAAIRQDSIPGVAWLHTFLEASKLAFADRNRYIADPDFVKPPGNSWNTMLHPDYLQRRAGKIEDMAMDPAEPGEPGNRTISYGSQQTQPENGTSHISIVDRQGRAVSMTSTIEQGFGSRIMSDGGTGRIGGFLLNNELTDFSLSPVTETGEPIANRVEPGKRPRSSMSPTLIRDLDTGDFVAAIGSPGGAAIIHYTAKTIAGMFEFGLNAQEAIHMPNFANLNGPSLLEEGRIPGDVVTQLEKKGHQVEVRPLTSGVQAIERTRHGYFSGADPRREGVAMGD